MYLWSTAKYMIYFLTFHKNNGYIPLNHQSEGVESTHFIPRLWYVMCCNNKRKLLLFHVMCRDKMRFFCLNQTQQFAQWQILIQRSGLAEGYTVPSRTVPLDLISGSGFALTVKQLTWTDTVYLGGGSCEVFGIQEGESKRNVQEIAQWGASYIYLTTNTLRVLENQELWDWQGAIK